MRKPILWRIAAPWPTQTESGRALHGMTLIETLAALVLLGLIMIGLAAWIGVAARATRAIETALGFDLECLAACRRIGEDLATGDFAGDEEDLRITIDRGALMVRTRALGGEPPLGSVTRAYAFDRDTQSFVRRTIDTSGGVFASTLVRGVREAWFEPVESRDGARSVDGDPLATPIFRVRIVGEHGGAFTWEWLAP